jgi:hypothetical protein
LGYLSRLFSRRRSRLGSGIDRLFYTPEVANGQAVCAR